MYKNCIKRLFDIVFSLLGMIILSPLFLGVALAIKIDDRGPVFFKQQRDGATPDIFPENSLHHLRLKSFISDLT